MPAKVGDKVSVLSYGSDDWYVGREVVSEAGESRFRYWRQDAHDKHRYEVQQSMEGFIWCHGHEIDVLDLLIAKALGGVRLVQGGCRNEIFFDEYVID